MAVYKYHCKGLDTKTPTAFMQTGYSYFQQNHRIYNGAFSPIFGKQKMHTSALNSGAVIRGATSWYDPANSYVAVVAVAGAKLYTAQWTADTGAFTFTDRTGATTITNANFKTFASLNNILVIAGGSASGDVLLKMTTTTGNAVNLGGTPPKGDCVQGVNNYLFVGRQMNAAGTHSRVSWSAVNDPETWSASDYVDFRLNDGDDVTALSSIGTDLIIFKNKSIGKLSTTGISVSGTYTLGPLVTISESIGTLSALSVDRLPDGTLVFLGGDANLYRCDGNTIVKLNDTLSPGPNYNIYSATFDPSTLNTYFLCVNPTYNEIRIKGGIVYNYIEKYWYTDSIQSTENVLFLVGPRRAGGILNAYTLCAGTTDGFIIGYDNAGVGIPSDVSGAATTSTVIFNVSMTDLGFSPRFMAILVQNIKQSATTFAVKFAWNGDPLFGTSVTAPFPVISGSLTWQTLVFPIPLTKTVSNSFPMNLSVLMIPTYSNLQVGSGLSFYFSDEDVF